MNLSNNIKFKFINSQLNKSDLKKLNNSDWLALYDFRRKRNELMINTTYQFSQVIFKGVVLLIILIILSAMVLFLVGRM